ncbi:MAG: hypothetical protein HY842_07370 [Bacteroidetes bacterium]|nr:hypothetical protein [Bacteroidota bacterium]
MKNFRYHLLLFIVVVMSAFSFVPMSHKPLEINRFIPEAVYELPPVSIFTLTASDIVAANGEEVCIEVKAKEFEQILSMQYSMNWDANVLKFKAVRNFGLNGMGLQNFGSHLAANGTLTFSWYDPALRGFSKPAGTKLYEVCFEAVGEPGSKAKFEFNGKPTMVEIANSSGVFLDLRTEGGAIEVK